MRGADVTQETLFTVKQLKDFVPTDHPLKPIRAMLDEALRSMDSVFAQMYSIEGRESIPPERLLRALALQALYSVRSERMLCEQLRYNLLFRWFVGLSMDDEPWDHSTFSKNRERLIADDVIRKLFVAVLKQARGAGLLSKEHFSVDGTLIRAWASHKSFQPRKGPKPPRSGPPSNPEVDFKGTKRHRDTHESSSDPDAFEYTKSKGVAPVPAYLGHVLMENRSGLAVDCRLTQAEGTSERDRWTHHTPPWIRSEPVDAPADRDAVHGKAARDAASSEGAWQRSGVRRLHDVDDGGQSASHGASGRKTCGPRHRIGASEAAATRPASGV